MAGKGNAGGRYRPSQARPNTLEQLRQYVWQELQQIGGAIDAASQGGLSVCDDISEGLAVDGDLIDYKPDIAKWCVGRRTRFIPAGYIRGFSYQRGDEVANGSQISECLVDGATESPYIAPTGAELQGYNGTLTDTSQIIKQLTFGQRYTFAVSGYLNTARVYAHAGMHYQLSTVRDPLWARQFNLVTEFTATTTGWMEVSAGNVLVTAGATVDLVATVSEPASSPVVFTRSYNYTTPQNNAAPASGQILHSNEDRAIINISFTDNGGGDSTADISSLEVGDRISTSTQAWVISSVSDFATYRAFGVTPAAQDVTDGVKVFTFETVTASPINYSFETDYYDPQPYPNVTIHGIIGIDVGYDYATIDSSAYGIDVKVQLAYIPTQWRVKVIAGEGGGIGGGEANTTSNVGAGTGLALPKDGLDLPFRTLVAGSNIMLSTNVDESLTISAGATGRPGVREITATAYTITPADENYLLILNNAAPVQVAVPLESTSSIPIGFITHCHQAGTGQVTLVPESGVTITAASSLVCRKQYSALSLFKIGTNSWTIVGDQL